MYRQKIITPLLAWGGSLLTYMLIIALSWMSTGSSSINGITQTFHYSSFDGPLTIVVLLACIALISTFRTYQPKIAYGGLHAYAWLLGLAFCYLASGNIRRVWYMFLFPVPEAMSWIFFSVVASIGLIILRAPLLRFLSYLMKPQAAQSSEENEPERPFYRRIFFTPLLLWTWAILTFICFFLLSWHEVRTSYGGMAYNTFDLPMGIVITAACISLIGSFRSLETKVAYLGLHGYLWCLGVALCYLQSGSERIVWYGLSFPALSSLSTGVLVAFLGSAGLWLLRTPVQRLIAYLLEKPIETKKRAAPQSETAHQSYQQGYQAANNVSDSEVLSLDDDYERPQPSYPHQMLEQQQS